jgi:hypothetical protein
MIVTLEPISDFNWQGLAGLLSWGNGEIPERRPLYTDVLWAGVGHVMVAVSSEAVIISWNEDDNGDEDSPRVEWQLAVRYENQATAKKAVEWLLRHVEVASDLPAAGFERVDAE